MVSAARRQIIGGGGAPINKSWRRRPQIVGGGGAARPAHGSTIGPLYTLTLTLFVSDLGNFSQGTLLWRTSWQAFLAPWTVAILPYTLSSPSMTVLSNPFDKSICTQQIILEASGQTRKLKRGH